MTRELLEVRQLVVRFGGLKAVDSVDFHVATDEIVSLIGPNGAGKTTIFNAITGFLRSEGSIRFGGRDLSNLRPHRIAAAGIVRTFQITTLFPSLSVMESVRTARDVRTSGTIADVIFDTERKRAAERDNQAEAESILGFVGLDDVRETLASNLPYGKQRMLGIAIALAAQPRVLLLDEPSAGLNDTETESMMRLIQKVRARGVAVLLVEHDMKLVMGISERVVVLSFGKKIAEGPPEEIRRNPEVIQAYLGRRRGRDAHVEN